MLRSVYIYTAELYTISMVVSIYSIEQCSLSILCQYIQQILYNYTIYVCEYTGIPVFHPRVTLHNHWRFSYPVEDISTPSVGSAPRRRVKLNIGACDFVQAKRKKKKKTEQWNATTNIAVSTFFPVKDAIQSSKNNQPIKKSTKSNHTANTSTSTSTTTNNTTAQHVKNKLRTTAVLHKNYSENTKTNARRGRHPFVKGVDPTAAPHGRHFIVRHSRLPVAPSIPSIYKPQLQRKSRYDQNPAHIAQYTCCAILMPSTVTNKHVNLEKPRTCSTPAHSPRTPTVALLHGRPSSQDTLTATQSMSSRLML